MPSQAMCLASFGRAIRVLAGRSGRLKGRDVSDLKHSACQLAAPLYHKDLQLCVVQNAAVR